jgi:hypothetical protein
MTEDPRAANAREWYDIVTQRHLLLIPRVSLRELLTEALRHVRQLLDLAHDASMQPAPPGQPGSYLTPWGDAVLLGQDVQALVGALDAAIWWAEYSGRGELVARWRSLGRALGDDR